MTFAWVRKLRTALHPLTVCRGLSAHYTFVDLGSWSQEVTTSALIVIYKQTSHHNVYTKYDRPFSIITFSHHYANLINNPLFMHIASFRISPPFPTRCRWPVGPFSRGSAYSVLLGLRQTSSPIGSASIYVTRQHRLVSGTLVRFFREEFCGWQVTFPLKRIYMQHFPPATK